MHSHETEVGRRQVSGPRTPRVGLESTFGTRRVPVNVLIGIRSISVSFESGAGDFDSYANVIQTEMALSVTLLYVP